MTEDRRPSLFERMRGWWGATRMGSISARVDDNNAGWAGLNSGRHDYNAAELLEIYQDALTAWRKNPIAWRIVQITSDYVVSDGIIVSSNNRALNRFIRAFWEHAQNLMDLRLESMCDELSRSGDLFVVLFRNSADGMSYIRFVTKDRISRIETAENDWESELAFYERLDNGEERRWLSPKHPEAAASESVMMHYAVNRPVGAQLGESDLTTMIPWLQRYSRMLEDRVKLNWAVRAFLWVVTVPANKVREKQEQYRNPPEAGSIVIKDDSESWQVYAPTLHGIDAARDLQAVRMMIDAGSGYPAHWRGEAGDANLATAQAMQGPTERHLLRRQKYFGWIIQDILYQAYQRAVGLGMARPLPSVDYSSLFVVQMPEISRFDNQALAGAARNVAEGLGVLAERLPRMTPDLAREVLALAFKFAGEPLDMEVMERILSGIVYQPAVVKPTAPTAPTAPTDATDPAKAAVADAPNTDLGVSGQ